MNIFVFKKFSYFCEKQTFCVLWKVVEMNKEFV